MVLYTHCTLALGINESFFVVLFTALFAAACSLSTARGAESAGASRVSFVICTQTV